MKIERVRTPFKRAGDTIEVPQRRGLGLEVDHSMLERYQVHELHPSPCPLP